MILSYQTIKEYCIDHQMIEPWSERELFSGMSYGLGPASYDFRIAQDIIVYPEKLTLCSTIERVKLPNHIAARVCDKSTWARRGIMVQNTHFDPGFVGVPTIELTNHSGRCIYIVAGTPICQFVFEFLDRTTSMPYSGKYQNQPAEPVEAKDEEVKYEQ